MFGFKKRLRIDLAEKLSEPHCTNNCVEADVKHIVEFLHVSVNRIDAKLDALKPIVDCAAKTAIQNSERLESILSLLEGRDCSDGRKLVWELKEAHKKMIKDLGKNAAKRIKKRKKK